MDVFESKIGLQNMRIKSFLFVFILFTFMISTTFPRLLLAEDQKVKRQAPLFDNLGSFHREISTKIPLAQRYFDQGLILFYSFEYGESIRSFRAAVMSDPQCAMCYWGLALALGSKTDAPLNGKELQEAKAAIKSAALYVSPTNIHERAYIAALTRRHLSTPAQKFEEIAGLCSSYSMISGKYAKDYASQMRQLIKLFPHDVDAKVLYAAALFDVTEWNFWNKQHQANPYTLEIIKTLKEAMDTNKEHPGANHLYVHIIEFSPYPKRAIVSAERLPYLVPGSEHIAHMPCHTYYSLGDYHDATIANQRAIDIYKNYAKSCHSQGFEPEIQYLYYHNYDYLVAAASMEGRKQVSISAAKSLVDLSSPLVEKNSFLQKWLTPYILTLSRFGEWDEISKVAQPPAKFQYALGIWLYGQSLAEIQLDQPEIANKHLKQLKEIIKQGPIDKNLGSMGYGLLQIGADILEGLLANRLGQTKVMLEKFKEAIKIQDNISSNDPPSWYFPVQQLLGNALLSTGRFSEAEMIFQQDLKEHPKNGWALFGLSKSLRQLGKDREADRVDNEFKKAWKYADIPAPVYLLPLKKGGNNE